MFASWFTINQSLRFIMVALYNIIIWYGIFSVLKWYFVDQLWNIIILLFSYIIGIFHSFVMFKIFVFQTKGNWIKECVKTYSSYKYVYIINLVGLLILVQWYKYNIYISQGICFVILMFIDYFILKYFSFSNKVSKKDKDNKEANLPK